MHNLCIFAHFIYYQYEDFQLLENVIPIWTKKPFDEPIFFWEIWSQLVVELFLNCALD